MRGFFLLFCGCLVSANAQTLSDTELNALAQKCAPQISADTLRALVKTESSFNPFAIAIVGGERIKQPTNLIEAIAAVNRLQKEKKNYSLGLGQINMRNFSKLELSPVDLFDPCVNLRATQTILYSCYQRTDKNKTDGKRLADAFSCYYSGNEITGYKHGYVAAVVKNSEQTVPSVKSIKPQDLNLSSSNSSNKCDGLLCESKSSEGLIF